MATINGTSGNDLLNGTSHADIINGDNGDDLIIAGSGNDDIDAGEGDDIVIAGSGNDVVDGGIGSDLILGGNGKDTIDGGDDDDVIFGGSGKDILAGGDGDDTIFGDGGDDTITGGLGADDLSGGGGDDVFIYTDASESNAESMDRIIGFHPGDDKIDVEAILGPVDLTWGNMTPTANGVWYEHIGGNTFVYADTDGLPGTRELVIELAGYKVLNRSDFLGLNAPAVISGDAIGAVSEDATDPTLTDSGTLSVADADAGENLFDTASVTDTTVGGALGTLSITAAGVWTYSVANAAVQYLGAGDSKVETFTVDSLDGTDTETITVTISGVDEANLAPTDIHLTMTHVPTGSTLPNGSATPLTLGTLSTADPDVGNTHLYSIEPGSSSGFAITGSSLQTTIALVEGLTYTLNVKSTDSGSPSMSLTETLHIIAGTSAGDAALMGTGGDDVIYGLGGADTITGSSGDDTIYGQNGGDALSGGDGADHLDGGGSADTLRGNDGHDVLIGAGGNDRLYGGAGDDLIDAGGNADQDIVFYEGVLSASDVLSNGSDMIVNFDADASAGGQDRINLDALFDSLGVANAARSARVSIVDGTDIRIDMDGDTAFEYLLATVITSSGTLDITDLVLS